MKKILTLSLIGLTVSAQANKIASWDTFGVAGDSDFVVGVGSPNVTAANIVRGPGLLPNSASNSFNSKDWDEVDPDDYISFGFTVDSGFEVSLDNLLIATRSSNTGPGTLGLYSSHDGFSSPVFTFVQSGSAFLNSDVDLSGIGSVGGALELRIIEIGNLQADGSGSTGSTGTFRVGDFRDASGAYLDIEIHGTLNSRNVPETPISLAFVGLALAGVVVTRRASMA